MLSSRFMDAATRKLHLRQWALASRDALPADERQRRSRRAAEHLLETELAAPDRALAVYAPIRSEADPSPLFERPRVAFPRVGRDGLELYWARFEDLIPRPPFSICEPSAGSPPAALDELALVVVPGLVFDRRGGRIGYGKGFYDRLLAQLRRLQNPARCVGFGFEAQVIDDLPIEPFDEPLDGLATETGLRWFAH